MNILHKSSVINFATLSPVFFCHKTLDNAPTAQFYEKLFFTSLYLKLFPTFCLFFRTFGQC